MREDGRGLERETKRLGCIGAIIGAAAIYVGVSTAWGASGLFGNPRAGAVIWIFIAAVALTVLVGVLLAVRTGGRIALAAILSFLFFPLGWLVALTPSTPPETVSRRVLRVIFGAVVLLSFTILALFAYVSGGT